MMDKKELRHVALGVGLVAIVAFVLFRHKAPAVVVTSQTPDSKPVAVPVNALGAAPDFSGLNGQTIPFGSYAPPGFNYNAGDSIGDSATSNYMQPEMQPDPSLTVYPSTTCGC